MQAAEGSACGKALETRVPHPFTHINLGALPALLTLWPCPPTILLLVLYSLYSTYSLHFTPCAVAGIQLVQKAGGEVAEAACVIELPELKGREKLGPHNVDLFVLVEKEGL